MGISVPPFMLEDEEEEGGGGGEGDERDAWRGLRGGGTSAASCSGLSSPDSDRDFSGMVTAEDGADWDGVLRTEESGLPRRWVEAADLLVSALVSSSTPSALPLDLSSLPDRNAG